MTGRLVVVGTPIGNLGDLSPRAAEALRTADLVAAEDTRRTGRLLAHVGSTVPQISYHDHNERTRTWELYDRLQAGATIALVTDAGMPGVSDPGYRLISAVAGSSIALEVIPGPSAVLHALIASGLPSDRFVFEGFLPRREGPRRKRIAELATEQRTMVLFLSPHRAAEELKELSTALDGRNRRAALCRELTKLHEEVRHGDLETHAIAAEVQGLRGEITVVIAGLGYRLTVYADADLVGEVDARVTEGMSRRDAIAAVAQETGVPKRTVYQAVVDVGGS